jgi:Zn-finger nucleic acid-binding protein
MFCPRCKTNLEKALFYSTEVDYCSSCLGMFFGEDELRWVKDEKDQNLIWLDIDLWKDEKKFRLNYGMRPCPACRLPLYEVYYGTSQVVVDLCNICRGIWLDRGEFKKIINYLQEESDWKVLRKYGQSLLEELREIFSGPKTFREEIADFLILLKLLNYKFSAQHPKISKAILLLPK